MDFYKEHPLVSVIITTYNRVDMLKRACMSVFKQDYKNIEIVIVDDNSPTDLLDTIDEIKKLSPFPILYFKNQENMGACYSRNYGISKAKGAFITGLDDDDEFLPERISYFINNYDPKYSFLSSNSKVITKKGIKLYCSDKNDIVVTLNDMLWSNICGTQIFIERNKILNSSGFDLSLTSAQDADMWLRLIEQYGPALRLRKPTFVLHTEHESGRISDNKIQGMKGILNKHKDKMTKSQVNFRLFKIFSYENKKNLLLKLPLFLDFKILKHLFKNKFLKV